MNLTDEYGRTPAFIASQKGHTEALKLLIEAGADVNLADKDGTTPAYIASQKGHTEAQAADRRRGGRQPDYQKNPSRQRPPQQRQRRNGVTPAYLASQQGQTEALKLLIDAGADVNLARNDGTTAYLASWLGHAEALKLLIEAGADVNLATENGVTPASLLHNKATRRR